jgi:predicted MPP superfamily phosphohydrolase
LLAVSVPLSLILSRLLPSGRWGALVWRPLLSWMGMLFILVVAQALTDVAFLGVSSLESVLFAASTPPLKQAADLPRQAFAQFGLLLGALGVALAWVQGAGYQVKHVAVQLKALPEEQSGLTLVQLSDVHIGPTLGRDFVKRVVATTNALKPDLVVITGDLVDGPASKFAEALAPLADLRSRHGTFFVTGNHEYYSGVDTWCQLLRNMGVRVLRNECVTLTHNGKPFDVLGVDDLSARAFGNGHGADLPKANAQRSNAKGAVLLAHQPRAATEAAQFGIPLQLSGHTHGGQIWPFSLLVKLQQPWVAGLQRLGDTQVYISRGTGYWGPPLRLFAPAEITCITLNPTVRLR